MLLLAFAELKCGAGPVAGQVHAASASLAALVVWRELVRLDIGLRDEDDFRSQDHRHRSLCWRARQGT